MSNPHTTPTTGAAPAHSHSLGEADRPGLLFAVFAAVVLLAAANVGLSSTGLGKYGLVIQLAIATVQAGLVSYYFMHLRQGDKVVILTALASIFWMGILFVLFMSDYMTRQYQVGW